MRRWTNMLEANICERIENCVEGLRLRYAVEQLHDFEIGHLLQRLTSFQTAISTDETVLIDGYHLRDGGHEVTLAIFEHEFDRPRVTSRGFIEKERTSALHELILMDIPVSVGRVLIRPETLGDKVSEWFAQRTLDLRDHPRFSSRYYVLAEDDERARRGLNTRFLETICQVDRLVVEIDDHTLAAMKLRPLAQDNHSSLVPLAFAMQRAWYL